MIDIHWFHFVPYFAVIKVALFKNAVLNIMFVIYCYMMCNCSVVLTQF